MGCNSQSILMMAPNSISMRYKARMPPPACSPNLCSQHEDSRLQEGLERHARMSHSQLQNRDLGGGKSQNHTHEDTHTVASLTFVVAPWVSRSSKDPFPTCDEPSPCPGLHQYRLGGKMLVPSLLQRGEEGYPH